MSGESDADAWARSASVAARVVDAILLAAFLALTFLLGIFPLKDTDFWWHLRTGDWIRQNGRVPTHDLYTFSAADHRWVDLHWTFQLALSWGYEYAGVAGLNLAKCAITCAAIFLLVSARRREWPLWPMLLAWLPALLVLSGRMYVRPETVSLLYLAAFLAILFRLDRAPRLAWLLPVVQCLWVNAQGLFVFGPLLLAFFLLAEVLRPGTFAPGRMRWWRTVLIGVALSAVACFINPYGWVGALYPLELARTMGNPVFSRSIAELTPLNEFIRKNLGWNNLPLRLHVATMALGLLSFLVPMLWRVGIRVTTRPTTAEALPPPAETKPKRRRKTKAQPTNPSPTTLLTGDHADGEAGGPRFLFRLLLFAAFCTLSWQATRNSHQFAAVVGTVTAWNVGEWAAEIRKRRASIGPPALGMRLVTLGAITAVFITVATGAFYSMAGEGRTIGLGEEPLWFPHDAVKFAGRPGMPERFVSFHDGYAALYEYHNGPERKVFADARLEVMGAELYQRYLDLQALIASGDESFQRRGFDTLDDLGRPAALFGHTENAVGGANLLLSPRWKCVWFDPIVAVFVHDAYADIVRTHEVDFAGRHFRPNPASEPQGTAAYQASARAIWTYAMAAQGRKRGDQVRPLVLLGLDYARKVVEAQPTAAAGWKLVGQLEAAREGPTDLNPPRFRVPFDPVLDMSAVRATYAFRRALEASPDDFMTLLLLSSLDVDRRMDEEALPLLERLLQQRPINTHQAMMLAETAKKMAPIVRAQTSVPAPTRWENLRDLDQIVAGLLRARRPRSAVEVLERAYTSPTRPWAISDRIGTLRLRLGEPEAARAAWEQGTAPRRPAIRTTRLAVAKLVEGDLAEARRLYRQATDEDPGDFDARYGLAIVEQDAGRAREANREARAAETLAPDDFARVAARTIVNQTAPYLGP